MIESRIQKMKLTGRFISCWLVCALMGISTMQFSVCVTAQEANITIPPKPVNISLNEVAEFNCTGVASDLVWKKNGAEVIHNGMEIVITQVVVNEIQSIRMSTMREMVSSLDSNGAIITCTAVKLSPLSNDESEPALLLVQGLLESVSNLTVYSINSTTVLISWSPPFTLKGVPILGYNITITNTLSGINKTVSTERDSNMLLYNFIDSDPSINYTITVIPINNVGVGNTSAATFFYKMITTSFSSQTSTIEFTPVSTLETSMTQSLSLSLSQSLSPSLSPTEANLGAIIGGIIAAVLVGTLALIIIVCISVLCCRRGRSDSMNVEKDITLPPIQSPCDSESDAITLEILTSHRSIQCKEVLSKLRSLSQDNIMYGEEICKGFFGVVYEAHLKDSGKHIAVKTCESSDSETVKCQFLHEAEILRHFDHPNIVKFIGVLQDPLSTVIEHVGSTFLYFLLTKEKTYQVNKLIEMCKQVCEGMEYLERNVCVHRGLTAQNCLVSSDFKVVKISNFGMSFGRVRLDPSDPKLRPVPIKWTAPEALNRDQYSSASDVWSFGVLLWETFSYGAEPYPGMTEEEVIEKVKNRHRMTPPNGCPLFDLMLMCWNFNPRDRPSFADLLKELCK